jgi:hypothetical protein
MLRFPSCILFLLRHVILREAGIIILKSKLNFFFGNNWYDFLADICVAGYNEFNYMQLYKIVYVYDDAEKKLYLSF